MQSGDTAAEGHANIIPGNATARITCRLVNNQSRKEIIDLIVMHIKKNFRWGRLQLINLVIATQDI